MKYHTPRTHFFEAAQLLVWYPTELWKNSSSRRCTHETQIVGTTSPRMLDMSSADTLFFTPSDRQCASCLTQVETTSASQANIVHSKLANAEKVRSDIVSRIPAT